MAKKKRKSKKSLGSISPAQIKAHLKAHGVRMASRKKCLNKRTGRLKKGCFWGRGSLRGKILRRVS